MNNALFNLENVSYGPPGGGLLVRQLSLSLFPGELLLITGANGCGKSTLIKVLINEVGIRSGVVQRNVASSRVAYIPQLENTEFHLPLTLRDLLEIGVNRTVKDSEAAAFELLDSQQLERAWNTASGGERKRALLTRVLLGRPDLLFLDEPLNHLDDESSRRVIQGLHHYLSEGQSSRGVVMVSHDGLAEEEKRKFNLVELKLDRGVGEVKRYARSV